MRLIAKLNQQNSPKWRVQGESARSLRISECYESWRIESCRWGIKSVWLVARVNRKNYKEDEAESEKVSTG